MSLHKRVKLAEGNEDVSIVSSDETQLSSSSRGDSTTPSDEEDLQNTDDKITGGQATKSRKTLKRKRRATEPSQFGATLRSLITTDAPSGHFLSLKPSVSRRKNNAKLELEARKVVRVERREKEERGRIRDIIGGWGGESERSLRKVAQRGVVKLFNTIQQSQLAGAMAEEEAKVSRGTGMPLLPVSSLSRKDVGKRNRNKVGLSRRGKQNTADKNTFFDTIRSGGIVSKA